MKFVFRGYRRIPGMYFSMFLVTPLPTQSSSLLWSTTSVWYYDILPTCTCIFALDFWDYVFCICVSFNRLSRILHQSTCLKDVFNMFKARSQLLSADVSTITGLLQILGLLKGYTLFTLDDLVHGQLSSSLKMFHQELHLMHLMVARHIWWLPGTFDGCRAHLMVARHIWRLPGTFDGCRAHLMVAGHIWWLPGTFDGCQAHLMVAGHIWRLPGIFDGCQAHLTVAGHIWWLPGTFDGCWAHFHIWWLPGTFDGCRAHLMVAGHIFTFDGCRAHLMVAGHIFTFDGCRAHCTRSLLYNPH